MKISFGKPALPASGVVVVGVLDENVLTPSAQALDDASGGALTRAIAASRFKGRREQTLTLLAPGRTDLDRVLVLGLGDPAKLDAQACQSLGGLVRAALAMVAKSASVLIDTLDDAETPTASMAAEFAFGARLRSYRFDKYRTTEKEDDKPSLGTLKILCDDAAKARKAFAPLDKVADGVFLTRDLVSEPANELYPASLAKRAKAELEPLGVEVEILGEKEMTKLGMGSLLGVGQGSVRESQLVIMKWNGGKAAPKGKKKKDATELPDAVAFVGKGVTFDTGGICIKPAGGMEDMKWDMGGSAAVIGLMKALAGRKAKVNAVGVVGLVENMPDGNAQRPGDVVKSMSGQTIEVINTDAEGRLVLADALWYTKKRFEPRFMVDLATLTGAIIISLGHEHAGLFSNDDELSQKITEAGLGVGEKVWRQPMGEAYDKLIKSDIADMKNVGGRYGGSITAAQFLQRFVDGSPWAHLDIAGVTWSKSEGALTPKGGTGFGVRLLDRMVAENYEK